MTDAKTIRIGIIGAGFARTTQIPGFQNCEGAQVVAIASARREHATEVAREFGIEHVETDWRALVARDDIDLVSIVTPPVIHCEMSLAAIERGKAVLCEKPMAMNAEEALRMTTAARDAGVLALIDHELRFLPGRVKMRELVRAGEIGKVRHAKLTFRADSRARPDWPWNWWSDATQGGGALGAIGSHVIDGFRWLLGAEISEVVSNLTTHVKERKDKDGQARPVNTDDEANLLLRFAQGEFTEEATGSVSLSLIEAGKPEHRLEIFGTTGTLMIEEDGELWQSSIGAAAWQSVTVDSGDLAPGMKKSGWAQGFTIFSQQIVDAMRAGSITVSGAATFEDGYRTQLVLDAARRSNQKGCWEKIE